jgi:putative transposase
MRNYNFRIYPREIQTKRLFKNFDISTQIWNELLSSKETNWKKKRKNLKCSDLYKKISRHKQKKEFYKHIHSHALQNVAVRVDNAYTGFFSRCKNEAFANKKKGYPKEKKRSFSITYPDGYGKGFSIEGKSLMLSKIGKIPIVLHQKIPLSKIKTATIKRKPSGKWYVSFSCDIKEIPKKKSINLAKPIGLDAGLPKIIYTSEGEQIENPKFYHKSQKKLKIFQRRVSRKQKGSHNRRKARYKLTKLHEKIENQRTDFLHQLSRRLADKYSFIAVEKLQVANMMANRCVSKSIQDTGWASLFQMLDYKANGKLFYNPKTRGSSCRCSKCGNLQSNPLDEQKEDFSCKSCGFSIQKDWNASINHLQNCLEEQGIKTSFKKRGRNIYLQARKKSILLNPNHNKIYNTVGNTEIHTLVERLPLPLASPKHLASNLVEARNNFLRNG